MSLALDAAPAPIERLAPRARLAAALLLLLAVASLRGLPAAGLALMLGCGLVLVSGQGLRPLGRRLVHLEGFMIVLLVMLPFTMTGRPLLALGPFVASAEGLLRAAGIMLRVNAAMLIVFALLGGLEPVRLGHAARRLGAPLRLVQLFLFTTRHVEIFRDEIRRRREAMRARGFSARASLHVWRSYGHLAGMVLVRSMDKAERVEEAMRARGFDGRLPAIGLDGAERGFGPCCALGGLAALALLALDRLT